MKILIATIMRNCAPILNRYWSQLNTILDTFPQHEWYLSIYENDSNDGTELIGQNTNFDFSRFVDYSIVSEKLGTIQYGSVINDERVTNLANARNKALYAKDMIQNVDLVLWIENDISYDMKLIDGLLNNPLEHVDIISGVNLDPHRGYATYDTWATRPTINDEQGTIYHDWNENPIREFYSTFNGICLYNAEPIKKGIAFGGYNSRLQKHDCDTVVICENFRAAGYDKIYINQSLHCFHL